MKSQARIVVFLVFFALANGCGAIGDARDETLESHQTMSDALGAYLSIEEPLNGDWDAFYRQGEQLLDELRAAHTEFAHATERAISTGTGNANDRRRYVQLIDEWIRTQDRQLSTSEFCAYSTSTNRCFAELLSDSPLQMSATDRAEIQKLSERLYGP